MRRISFDLRGVVAATLALATGLLVLAATDGPDRAQVVVADADLPTGRPLSELSLETITLEASPGLVLEGDLKDLANHVLRVGVREGDPLVWSMLALPDGSEPDAIALTLDAAHAVQGELGAGDRIDIYTTSDGTSVRLATDIEVLSIAIGHGSLSTGEVAVTVAVDDELARELVEALHTSAIDIVRRAR